jgi:hypothetical protein
MSKGSKAQHRLSAGSCEHVSLKQFKRDLLVLGATLSCIPFENHVFQGRQRHTVPPGRDSQSVRRSIAAPVAPIMQPDIP